MNKKDLVKKINSKKKADAKVSVPIGGEENWKFHHLPAGPMRDKRHRKESRRSWRKDVEY